MQETEAPLLAVEEIQLPHQLAAVADTEREGVGAGVKLPQRLAGPIVVPEAGGKAGRRPQHIAVGEASAEDDHPALLQGLATAHQVTHVDIPHIETGQPEGVGHLSLAIRPLVADDGAGDATPLLTIPALAVVGERASLLGAEPVVQRLS